MQPTSLASSHGLLALTLALLMSCRTSAPLPPAVGGDPMEALPDGARLVDVATPYRFRNDNDFLTLVDVKLGQNPNPTARLILARTYLDGLLFAELKADSALRERLSGRLKALSREANDDPWAVVRNLFAEAGSGSDEAVATVASQGVEFVDLLVSRKMDTDYHAAMTRLATGTLEVEVAMARLLDYDAAMRQVEALPPDRRLGAVVTALAPDLCSSAAPSLTTCELVCPEMEGLAISAPASFEAVAMGVCGRQELGWPVDVHDDLYHWELAAIARVTRQALDDAALIAGDQSHPLSHQARPAIELLVEGWAAKPLFGVVRVDGPTDFADIELPTAPSARPWGEKTAPILVLDRDSFRVAIPPGISADPNRTLALAGSFHGWPFPGRRVFQLQDTRLGTDAFRGWSEEALWDRYRDAERAIGTTGPVRRRARLATFVHAGLEARTVLDALDVARSAVGSGGRLRVELATWNGEAGSIGFESLELVDRPAHTEFEGIPDEARPLELTITIRGKVITVAARGRRVAELPAKGDGLDQAGLGKVIADLHRSFPSDDTATVEFDPRDTRLAWRDVVATVDTVMRPAPGVTGFTRRLVATQLPEASDK